MHGLGSILALIAVSFAVGGLLGAIVLRRGRSCGRSRRIYPAMAVAALCVALSALPEPAGWPFLASCLFGWTLLALAVIDVREGLLPDGLTLPLIPLGLAVAWLIDPRTLPDRFLGVALGFILFDLLARLYRRLRGRPGLGGGDAKLLAGLGAWVGWSGLPQIVLGAALLALLVTLLQAAAERRRSTAADRIAFGPYLALAGWVVWLYGPLALV